MNGILLVDKPRDWTSFDVAAKLKGLCKTRRIGHSGTLDPMATGLLVMFLGRATRAVPFAEEHDKRYIASLRPGLVTDTQDVTGNVLEQNACSVTAEELEEAVKAMRKAAGEATKELSLDEMGKTAGGIFWTGEDAPDGHEMGCFMTYHHHQWSVDNNIWCKSTFYCTGSYTSDDPDWSGDN
jgi:hypothetical protein